MKPGDLYWVEFPAGGGHAQSGRRPAIVLQAVEAAAALSTVLLMPLTTQMDALRFPGTALIQTDRVNGLRRASAALALQMTVIDKRFISAQIGILSNADLKAVWEAFDSITGRP